MDTITHGLAGYVVAKTGLTRDTGRWGVVAGVAASLFPDADNLLGAFYGTEFTLRYHRGLTNSLLMVIPFSLLFAWLFTKISKKRRFWTFFLIWVVEILVHTFLDLITSFGTMILSPLLSHRFALDWVFIIDLYLTGILLMASITILLWKSKGKTIAKMSAMLAALYISLCAGNHSWALSTATNYAQQQSLKTQQIASLPQPLSPFHWANYVVTEDKIYRGLVNLVGTQERTARTTGNLFSLIWSRYQPINLASYEPWDKLDGSIWVRRALPLKGVRNFFWFARFPVVSYEGASNGRHRVTFYDLRFGTIGGRRPFLYEVVFDPKGEILSQGYPRDLVRNDD